MNEARERGGRRAGRLRAEELLERRVAERTRELSALLEVSRSLTSTLALELLLDLILDQLLRVLDYRSAGIIVVRGEAVETVAMRDTVDRARERVQVGYRVPLAQFAGLWQPMLCGEPLLIGDVRRDDPAARAWRNSTGYLPDPSASPVRAWLGLPLSVRGQMVGIFGLTREVPDSFTAHDIELAVAFGDHAAIALENAHLYGEAQKLAALEERQRLARELHDSVSQALFGIALGAGAARRRLELDPARVGESLDYVLSLTEVALTEMRALIFELRPETLEKEGLVAALSRHAAATQARHQIAVETTLCAEPDVPLATKEALYRIAQEAMHNAAKYARGTRIDLVLACDADHLILEVRDDGVGFDATQDFAGHLGLHSMRERMAALGGTTEVTSVLGQGTSIRAAVPSG